MLPLHLPHTANDAVDLHLSSAFAWHSQQRLRQIPRLSQADVHRELHALLSHLKVDLPALSRKPKCPAPSGIFSHHPE